MIKIFSLCILQLLVLAVQSAGDKTRSGCQRVDLGGSGESREGCQPRDQGNQRGSGGKENVYLAHRKI